jgi:hypothetical protein
VVRSAADVDEDLRALALRASGAPVQTARHPAGGFSLTTPSTVAFSWAALVIPMVMGEGLRPLTIR